MGIVIHKNIPILKSREECRKNDFLRGMCKYVNTRVKVDKAMEDLRKPNEDKQK